jgi:hypothetical protein
LKGDAISNKPTVATKTKKNKSIHKNIEPQKEHVEEKTVLEPEILSVVSDNTEFFPEPILE